MQVAQQHRYPAKVDEVVGLMTDESVLAAKCRELEQPPPQRVEVRSCGDVVELHQRRAVRFAVAPEDRRLLCDEPVIDSVERWEPEADDGSRRATIELRGDDLPVRATGTMVLTPDGDDGCVCDVLIELRSDVPVIGGRIVAAMARGTEELLDADHRANISFLRRRRP